MTDRLLTAPRLRYAALLFAVTVLLLGLPATSAEGQDNYDDYHGLQAGHRVGQGCDKIPADVGFLQGVLWTARQLDDVDEVDKVWGPATRAATERWQRSHGLAADGCAGYQTWSRIAYGYRVLGPQGRSYHYRKGPWEGTYRKDKWFEPGTGRELWIDYGDVNYSHWAYRPRNLERMRRSTPTTCC